MPRPWELQDPDERWVRSGAPLIGARWDAALEKWVPELVQVTEDGLLISVQGSLQGADNTSIMSAPAGTAAGATQIYSNPTGWRRMLAFPVATLPAGERIVLGYSDQANDEATLQPIVDAVLAALTTPDGVDYANVKVLGLYRPAPVVLELDRGTIKTVIAKTTNTAKTYVLEKLA